MKNAAAVVLATVWFATSCGKVGDPRPPFIRIPEPVADLTAAQEGYRIILSWTNPARYIDGSSATDLAIVRLARNGNNVESIPVTSPGKPQVYEIDAVPLLNSIQRFTIEVQTRGGKVSALSSPIAIRPTDVPGPVRNLTAVVDQGRIRLQWQPPEVNAPLAEAYIVQRQGDPSSVVTDTHYEDEGFTAGQTIMYTVTAARGREFRIPGVSAPPLSVHAVDTVAPQTPKGLQIIVPNPPGAFLQWEENSEVDLGGYRIYRSDRPDGGFVPLEQGIHTTTGFFDAGYRAGFYYAVSAVDVSGNESLRTMPVAGP